MARKRYKKPVKKPVKMAGLKSLITLISEICTIASFLIAVYILIKEFL